LSSTTHEPASSPPQAWNDKRQYEETSPRSHPESMKASKSETVPLCGSICPELPAALVGGGALAGGSTLTGAGGSA
jgi:hypothetical protein